MWKRMADVGVLLGLLVLPSFSMADDVIELGKEFKGEIKGPSRMVINGGSTSLSYVAKVKVKLKAEQDLTITVAVTGDGRLAAVRLLDPDLKTVASSTGANIAPNYFEFPHANPAKLAVKEVSATSEYTIEVFSDRVGVFTLLAKTSQTEKLDEKGIDEKIKKIDEEIERLKREREELVKRKSLLKP